MQSRFARPSPSAARPLDQCRSRTTVQILEIQAHSAFGQQDDRITLRLKELGFLPGATLRVIGFGLLGSDPIAVQVNGTKFALRRAEASKILVNEITG